MPFPIVIKAVYETFSPARQPEVSGESTENLIHGRLADASADGGSRDRR